MQEFVPDGAGARTARYVRASEAYFVVDVRPCGWPGTCRRGLGYAELLSTGSMNNRTGSHPALAQGGIWIAPWYD